MRLASEITQSPAFPPSASMTGFFSILSVSLPSRLESVPVGSAHPISQCLKSPGRHRRQGGLRRKAHPEPLPSFADRKAFGTFYASPVQGRASLDTINGAITPWRDTFAEQTSLPRHSIAARKPLPQGYSLSGGQCPPLPYGLSRARPPPGYLPAPPAGSARHQQISGRRGPGRGSRRSPRGRFSQS